MGNKRSPCERCASKTCGGIRYLKCYRWMDWFRRKWRTICEDAPGALERKQKRAEQREYLRMLYREDTGGWKDEIFD